MLFALSSLLFLHQCYGADWDYDESDNNISNWIEHYPECGGTHQSPIDIEIDTESVCSNPLLLQWTSENLHFAIRNNGHSLQAVPFEIQHLGGSDISRLEVLHHTNDTNIRLTNSFYNTYTSNINEHYCFDSLHFHWGTTDEDGSEHTINGDHYPLEVHLVHFSCDFPMITDALDAYTSDELTEEDDRHVLAVIAILFEIGDANPVLDAILSDVIVSGIQYHDPENAEDHLIQLFYTEFNPMDLLPENKEFIGYKGSLTTPPCYETVRWNVMHDTMTVSLKQMEQFRLLLQSTDTDDIIAPNWRQTLDIENRTIYQCQDTVDTDAVREDAVHEYPTHWDYDEEHNNASHWHLDYPECGGMQQSPIDIAIEDNEDCEEALELEWSSETVHFGVRNNGHTLYAVPFEIIHSGSSDLTRLEVLHHRNDTNIRLKNSFFDTYKSNVNSEYCFDSLHFHWGIDDEDGSEHAIDGEHYALEAHLVHFSCDFPMITDALEAYSKGELTEVDDHHVLAVIGVLFEIGDANPVLDAILSDVIVNGIRYHDPENDEQHVIELFYTEFDPMELLPENKEFIGYKGSLTTPPCYETVRWNVMKDTMTVSVAQMEQFRSLMEASDDEESMAPNWRPLQDTEDRTIYQCEDTVDASSVTKEGVSYDDDGSDTDGDDDDMSTWKIIGIVFICLFSVAVLVIVYLSKQLYCNDKRTQGYSKARAGSFDTRDKAGVETGAINARDTAGQPLQGYH